MKNKLLFLFTTLSLLCCKEKKNDLNLNENVNETIKISNSNILSEEQSIDEKNQSSITKINTSVEMYIFSYTNTQKDNINIIDGEVYKKDKVIKNSAIFNENSNILLSKISNVIFDKLNSLEDKKQCYSSLKKENLTFDDLIITANETDMYFYLPYIENCTQIGTSVNIDEVKEYMVINKKSE